MLPGFATIEGTARYAARRPLLESKDFYRKAQGLAVSSLGLGTYLGALDEQTDRGYQQAARAALDGGINFFDTSLNYRHQRSERCLGAVLETLQDAREEVVVCTKAGYLVPDAVPSGVLRVSDVAGGIHSMAPAFLADQLERSRANLNLETIDVFYLHNPETQLAHVSREEFYERIRQAFSALEELVAGNRIRYYGTATWEGYRKKTGDGLSLARLVQLATQIAGPDHHFRFVQLPFNLGMVEAFAQKAETIDGQPKSVLEVAQASGVTVVASATLLQSRLARDLPEQIAARLPGLSTDAQRAVQFTRSTPGVSVALVGMSSVEHVGENLGVAACPPAAPEQYMEMFR